MSTGSWPFPPTAGRPSAPRAFACPVDPRSPVTDLTTPAPGRDGPWLSLGPASRLLGVDPDTLRRWADAGRVETWTTPGGHRRFDRRRLEQLLADRRAGRSRSLATMG